ncbi:MAG TPA: dienelactone hydrolase family protein [Euzebya sp.]|nr:dienelactone hydrolase family protein [Euzebya sp.]
MASVILFHSALGLRPAVTRMAKRLQAAGHQVLTPDLYQGRVFDELDQGIAHRDELGIPELSARAQTAVEPMPRDVVYMGLSMGAASAIFLSLTRPGGRGVVLLHGVIPPQMMGVDAWPADLPVLVHRSAEDPEVDADAVELFHRAVPESVLEEHVHASDHHLFTDDDLPEHDPDAAEEVIASVLRFLTRVG